MAYRVFCETYLCVEQNVVGSVETQEKPDSWLQSDQYQPHTMESSLLHKICTLEWGLQKTPNFNTSASFVIPASLGQIFFYK